MYCSQECFPGFRHCLSAEECNFYLEGTKNIIYNTPVNQGGPSVGYTFCSVVIKPDMSLYGGNNEFHTAEVVYGKLRIKTDPINEF